MSESKSEKPSGWVDIAGLPRPAAGLGKVDVPATMMKKPELPAKVKVESARESEGEDESTEMITAKPAYTKRTSSAKLVDHQKHAIAEAMVLGLPISDIASMVRHTPAFIKKCIEEDPDIKQYVEHYSSKLMRAKVEHQFSLLERMDAAWRVLDDALIDKDIRVRMMAMDKVFAGASMRVTGETPLVEMNFTDPAAHKALQEATMGIHDLLKEIQVGNIVPDSINKHLRSSLPGPEDVVGHVPRRG